ncbi:hypothetical protein D3C78_889020 [compost metagenome]
MQAKAVIRLAQQLASIAGTLLFMESPFKGHRRRCTVRGGEARSERHAAADLALKFAAFLCQIPGQRKQRTQSARFGAEAQAVHDPGRFQQCNCSEGEPFGRLYGIGHRQLNDEVGAHS